MFLKSVFFTTAAYSGVMVRAYEDGDAAVSTVANAGGSFIARDIHLITYRVSRNRMGACRRCRAGILANGIRSLVDDAEYRTGRGQSEVVVTAGKKEMVIAGIVPNFVVTVQAVQAPDQVTVEFVDDHRSFP